VTEPLSDERRPVPSAPVPSAPVPSAVVPSAVVPSAPVPSAPVPSAPVPSAPRQAPGPQDAPNLGEHSTGDIVIDSALQDLRNAPADDLDAQIEAGRRVHQTLQGRLSHLGGE
jgi:hypothetical protein